VINLSYILVGLVTGFASGCLGIGGGIIAIPALVYIYGLTQHQAQGTSLAMMVLPITFFATLKYYQSGNVKIVMALLLALGFIFGGILGAALIQPIPEMLLKRIFGSVLLIVALKMIFFG
jgi:uncharacterized membrane protein YfcA